MLLSQPVIKGGFLRSGWTTNPLIWVEKEIHRKVEKLLTNLAAV
jgi:hypothetical protein